MYRIATLAESYHGDTVGSMSLGYSETFHRFHKSLLFPVIRITPPHVFRYYQGMSEADAPWLRRSKMPTEKLC